MSVSLTEASGHAEHRLGGHRQAARSGMSTNPFIRPESDMFTTVLWRPKPAFFFFSLKWISTNKMKKVSKTSHHLYLNSIHTLMPLKNLVLSTEETDKKKSTITQWLLINKRNRKLDISLKCKRIQNLPISKASHIFFSRVIHTHCGLPWGPAAQHMNTWWSSSWR